MSNLEQLKDIIDKTIDTIKVNKSQVLSITDSIKKDHEQKHAELVVLQKQIPWLLGQVQRLGKLDQSIRLELIEASNDFSPKGQAHLQQIYAKATDIHSQLLLLQEQEKLYRNRRDSLAIELKNCKYNIECAEAMAQQITIALSYLQQDLFSTLGLSSTDSLTAGLQVLKALEAEKMRIARDIHDGPAQHLASINMNVDFCKQLLQKDLDAGLDSLDQLKTNVGLALREVRGILFDLNPAPLEDLGFEVSIQTLVETIFEGTATVAILDLSLTPARLSSHLQNAIYRITQELLNNVKKHAKATKVTISIKEVASLIFIQIGDNGIGMEASSALHPHSKSYGLSGLTTRIGELQGTIDIKNAAKQGTQVKVKLPISN